jgi:UDP-N-acetylmuramoylalanine--D-glutamate ligase
MEENMSGNLHVIVGLGVTALSCARYLTEQNIPIAMADTRETPPHLAQFKPTPISRWS